LQAKRAEVFRELHHGRKPLILPNAWDVPSARIFENEGFPAAATSIAAVMVSLGHQDGEEIGRREYLKVVERICAVLSVPLSVDAVAGFARTPREVAETARGLIRVGAVGINIEDFEHETKKLFPVERQVEKLKAIRLVGEALKVPLVVNARTDALRYAPGDDEARFDEAVSRGMAFRDAGADCVYPMGLVDRRSIFAYVKAIDSPINVMIRKGLPPISVLQELGVARVSFGPGASYAALGLLKRISREVQTKGTYNRLLQGSITFDELNSLAVRKAQGGAGLTL
jgi:2-methylisocitrate lyase-like PEP mutase family enzyme